MQTNTGLRSVLKAPSIYSAFQDLIGARRARSWLIKTYLSQIEGKKVVDIGCGPGDILLSLPPIEYVGIDISPEYIQQARTTFGTKGTFLVGDTEACLNEPSVYGADIVTCFGVMHHLDDGQTEQALAFARKILAPGGRFFGYEPCFLEYQSKISRFVMNQDRGRNIRLEREWKALMFSSFPRSSTTVLTGLIRIPYTHIVLEGFKS